VPSDVTAGTKLAAISRSCSSNGRSDGPSFS